MCLQYLCSECDIILLSKLTSCTEVSACSKLQFILIYILYIYILSFDHFLQTVCARPPGVCTSYSGV